MKSISTTLILIVLFNGGLQSQNSVKLTKQEGVYIVPCSINGKSTNFIFDSGASDVTISLDYFNLGLQNGIFKQSDVSPQIIKFQVATGEISEGRIINIRELKIGELALHNIKGTIISGKDVPMLLGQTALEEFGKYAIDYSTLILTIEGNLDSNPVQALKNSKAKLIQQMKASGQSDADNLVNGQILETADQITKDIQVASNLEFEVVKLIQGKGEYLFQYDITNNSKFDYKFKALSAITIHIEIMTEDNKVSATSTLLPFVMLKGTTVNGVPQSINLGEKKPKFFRIFATVSGPLLSTIE